MLLPVLVGGALAPLGAAALMLALLLRPWSAAAGTDDRWRRLSCGAAVGAGYLVGHVALAGWPWAPGIGVVGVLPYLALLGLLAAAVTTVIRGTWALWALRSVFSLGAAVILLRPLWAQGPSTTQMTQMAVALVVAAGATLLAWSIADRLAADEGGPSLALGLLILLGGSAVTLVLSGTAIVGQLCGVLIAAVTIAMLAVWRWPLAGRLRSAVPVVILPLVGQWTIGLHYAEMPRLCFLLLASAPLGFLAVRLPPLANATKVTQLIVRVICVGLLVGGATGVAAASYFQPEPVAPAPSSSPNGAIDYNYGY